MQEIGKYLSELQVFYWVPSVTGNTCSPCGENIYSIEAYERRTVFFNHLFPTTVNSCQDRQLPILIAPVHTKIHFNKKLSRKSEAYLILMTITWNTDWFSKSFD